MANIEEFKDLIDSIRLHNDINQLIDICNEYRKEIKRLKLIIDDRDEVQKELYKQNGKLKKELHMAEKTIEDLNLTIRQYEKGFSNGSRLGDDLE